MIRPEPMLIRCLCLVPLLLGGLPPALAQQQAAKPADSGLLDMPVTPAVPARPGVDTVAPGVNVRLLARQVRAEQSRLERLPVAALKPRAEAGDRIAQAALASHFGREAQRLSALPVLANDAAADALRWYSLMASRGVPSSAAIDVVGVRSYPVRVARGQQARQGD